MALIVGRGVDVHFDEADIGIGGVLRHPIGGDENTGYRL
jgi:hypothetical protein